MFIKELILLTNDIASTKAFYHGQMGFTIKEETEEYISFNAGSSVLAFRFTEKYNRPFYHIAFSIPNNKLTEAFHWIEERAPVLPYQPDKVIADFTGWNAKAFYFHDNQENILEFITHFDLNTNDQKSFTSASVESICEIGIVTDDVSKTCEAIKSKYNIPYFVKGPLMHDFAVMGDSTGLLIVSKTHRGWLPTLRPCWQFPVIVKINVNGKDIEISSGQ
jgi:hypothetical protein